MENPSPRILSTDRLGKGVIVVFEDDLTALYSADVLHAILDKAKILHPDDDEAPADDTGA